MAPSAIKELLRRLALIIFGVLAGLLGFVSFGTGLMIMVMSFAEITDRAATFLMALFMFALGEVFLAFGVSTLLFGLRCIIGPRRWIDSTVSSKWVRAAWIAILLPFLWIPIAVIVLIAKLILSMFG